MNPDGLHGKLQKEVWLLGGDTGCEEEHKRTLDPQVPSTTDSVCITFPQSQQCTPLWRLHQSFSSVWQQYALGRPSKEAPEISGRMKQRTFKARKSGGGAYGFLGMTMRSQASPASSFRRLKFTHETSPTLEISFSKSSVPRAADQEHVQRHPQDIGQPKAHRGKRREEPTPRCGRISHYIQS